MNTATFVTCKCNHCSGQIEFDASDFSEGTRTKCPHCGMETILYIPAAPQFAARPNQFTPRADKPQPEAASVKQEKKRRASLVGPIISFVIGCGLVLKGCAIEVEAKSAVHQQLAAIQYCTGWILIALSFVLEFLRSINRNQ